MIICNYSAPKKSCSQVYLILKKGVLILKNMAETTEKKKEKDGLSLIIGGIFILTLVFATYNYFNKGREKNIKDDDKKSYIESIFENNSGDLNGEGAKEDKNVNEEDSDSVFGASVNQQTESMWVANNYEKGDIEGDTYKVIEGDTLWEIAEAVYGSGFEWGRILEANQDSVGFLPNGSQALITAGQVLVLP